MNVRQVSSAVDIAQAVDDDQLRLYLQPLVTAYGRQCAGFEALIRWQHPTLGLLEPEAFIPVIEHTDTIVSLTYWVLDRAIEACARWRSSGQPYTVSVNVSPRLLGDDGLPARIDRRLHAASLAPHALTVEITESSLVDDPDVAHRMFRELRNRGIRISIDDFGTGYTSLAMLRMFQFDELKIDGSFVDNLTTSPADAAIVRSILELGHRLGLEVVAEHVENDLTARTLTRFGCDLLQGYHFGRPQPIDDALAAAALLTPSAELRQAPAGAVPAVLPQDESRRLEVLRELEILDTEPEPIFDSAATIAAAICGVSVGLVTFVDHQRQWFKARHGIDVTETDRDSSFCAHAILHDAVFEIPDARGDPRFRDNPLVTGTPHIRFYAGAPLVTDDGLALGTLCVLDSQPRTLADDQRVALQHLAAIVVDRLGSRRRETADRQLAAALSVLSRVRDPAETPTAARAVGSAHARLLGADAAGIWLPDGVGSTIFRAAAITTDPVPGSRDDLFINRRDHEPDIAAVVAAEKGLLERTADGRHDRLGICRRLGAEYVLAHALCHDDVVGVLVSWWGPSRQPVIDDHARDQATLLADAAAAALTRLNALSDLGMVTHTDALTGLANRRGCLARLRTISAGSGIVLIDLDRFKDVNDTVGHQAADLTLRTFTSHLRNAARPDDVLARWGDAEFLVAVRHGGIAAANDVVRRLRTSWRHPPAPTTFSAGVTVLDRDESLERALERADRALLQAKRQGRDQSVVRDIGTQRLPPNGRNP